MEEGREPHGVMLAALEAYSSEPRLALQAMARAAAGTPSNWHEGVIKGVYKAILLAKTRDDFVDFLWWASHAAHRIDAIKKDRECRVAGLVSAVNTLGNDDMKEKMILDIAATPEVRGRESRRSSFNRCSKSNSRPTAKPRCFGHSTR